MFKPMLFNTEMVRAILGGRKTQTRRIIKLPEGMTGRQVGESGNPNNPIGFSYPCGIKRPPCDAGDILWVRETWCEPYALGQYAYHADYADYDIIPNPYGRVSNSANMFRWRPSIHMPKDAARIFLCVKDVRVEHLDDMRLADFLKEGVRLTCQEEGNLALAGLRARERFAEVWDDTIKPADLPKYRWDANPWVWVIEFERIEKPEGWPKA